MIFDKRKMAKILKSTTLYYIKRVRINNQLLLYEAPNRYIVYCQFVKICNKSLVIEMFISHCYCLIMNNQWTNRLSGIGICQSSMYLSLLSWLLLVR